MPSVKLSPVFNEQVVTSAGAPASGYLLYTYAAGSTTAQTTYTTSAGTVAQANPIVLNANGAPDNPIWLTAGQSYKFVLKDAGGVTIRTVDNVAGVNDNAVSVSQWLTSGVTPTYVSGTSFTMVGDQTSEFHVGRRLQFTVTAGTVYGTISVSAYTTLTTVTVVLDSGALDAGLSAVNLSILRADHPAIPIPTTQDIQLSAGKSVIFEGTTDNAFEVTLSGGDPTADRTVTLPDRTGTVALSDAMPVGTVIHSISATPDTGWLALSGGTIGNASSGGTVRANADTEALFTKIWNNTSNTDCPVQTSAGGASSRGASAAADFAANKRITLPNANGRVIRVVDQGAGIDPDRTNGSVQAQQMPAHTHTGAVDTSFGIAGGGSAYFVGSSGTAATGSAGTGTDLRMANLALYAHIRYL